MARKFDGTSSDRITLPLDLSNYSTLSVSLWLYWDTNASAFKEALTFGTPNWQTRGFSLQPDQSSGYITAMGLTGSTGWGDSYAKPSAAAWHHHLLTYDRANPGNAVWVDGVEKSLTLFGAHAAGTYGNFGNDTLYIMHRPSANYGLGRIAEVAIWGGVKFGLGEASELSKGASPLTVAADRLVCYLPLFGDAGNAEQVYGANGVKLKSLATRVGTVGIAGSFSNRPVLSNRKAVIV